MNQNLLSVKIVSPKQDFYNGPALAVSSVNSAGPFDILPQHANMLTLVKDKPIIIRIPNNPKPMTFQFPLAIIYTAQNQVHIFTDIQIQVKTVL